MATVVERKVLAQALSEVAKVSSSKSTLPVLANVKFNVGNGLATLTCCNLEAAMIAKVPADAKEEFSTTVPAKTLLDWLNAVDGDTVKLSVGKNGKMNLSCGTATAGLSTIAPDEFPPTPGGNFAKVASINAETFRKVVGRVANTASQDEARPILTGVHIFYFGIGLTFETADGFRLARQDRVEGYEGKCDVTIPARMMKVIANGANTEVAINVGNDTVMFESGPYTMYIQKIVGTFPDTMQIIPNKNKSDVLFAERYKLERAVKAIQAVTTNKVTRVKLSIDGNNLVVSGEAQETGSTQTTIELRNPCKPCEIGLNSAFLLSALSTLESKSWQWRTRSQPAR